ncbi:MAG TPA: hypothetical protein VMF88_01480 [Bacteroidota bacterium]|nr:hypothetical protein [Bacteroidota bacterium]
MLRQRHTLRLRREGVILFALVLATLNFHCQRGKAAFPPDHYLLITHSALNRITIFDLAADTIVGALPTQKLPHDMIVSRDRLLYVVNSGAQSITTYDLKNPEFWEYARQFIKKDSSNLSAFRSPSPSMMGQGHEGNGQGAMKDSSAWITLNRAPAQLLPASFARTYLTDPNFPDIAKPMHEKVNAMAHATCYDCHDRSVGAKPFAPKYSSDSSEIFIVQLGYRTVSFLDSKTLSVKRRIPVPCSSHYSPIEAWITPDQRQCFVTCRNEIGQSKPGLILVLDLHDGRLLKSITAGIYPWHLLPSADGSTLYVNNFQSSRISIVDVKKMQIVDSIVVQNGPSMMLLQPENGRIVVSCFYTDRVLFVDLKTKEVLKEIPVDANPTSLEFSPGGKLLYVLCGGESSLDMIDVDQGKVIEKHKMLFGAYAFHSMDEREHQ